MAAKKKKTRTLMDQISLAAVCFMGGMFCILYAAQFQGELLGTGSAEIGRNEAFVKVTGDAAQLNINFFWLGAVVFFIAALVLLVIAARREMTTDQPFGNFFSSEFLICPECERAFLSDDWEEDGCPDCNIGLVKLKGFYSKSQ